MSNEISITGDPVAGHIYILRHQKVILDDTLADLYNVETRVLNQAVNSNRERFPDDFMFQLEKDEWENLRSQFVILKTGRGGRRSLPYAFTEHGVLTLSSVLNSERAILVNIQIVRIFAYMRHAVLDNAELKLDIEKVKSELKSQGKTIEVVFKHLDELVENKQVLENRKPIGYRKP